MVTRSQEWTAVLLTAMAGVAALAGALLFRDQLPVSREAARVAGFCLLYGGMALFLWSASHLGRAIGGRVAPVLDHFVVTGPYRFVRHPAYLAMTIALIGAGIVTRSLAGLLLTLVVFAPAEVHRARLEERALADVFGIAWEKYAARTGFFLPRLRRP